jgi:tetratricopeptide (TPR) repeat protein
VLVYHLANLMTKSNATAFTAALFYCCHPALTEAVNAISFNEDLLVTLFFLLALAAYIKIDAGMKPKSWRRYGLSLVFFLCGLLSKEMAITLPVVIVLYDLLIGDASADQLSWGAIANIIRIKKLYYCGYAAISLFYLGLRFFLLKNPAAGIPFSNNPLIDRIAYLPDHIFNYIKIALWPLDLTADYIFSYPTHFFGIRNLTAIIVIVGLICLCIFIYKTQRVIVFGIGWFLLTLFPVWNFVEIHNPLADRYLALPLVGFCMALSMFLHTLLLKIFKNKTRRVNVTRLAIALPICIFYSAITIPRNAVWRDEYSLWTETVKSTPNSALAHGNLGRVYQKRGLFNEAAGEYRRSIELRKRNDKAFYNLGTLYERQGLIDEAVRHYKKALEFNPEFIDAYYNLGNIYATRGLLDDARNVYQKVIEKKPGDFQAQNNLGVIYARQKKFDLAIKHWQIVLDIDPMNQKVKENIIRAAKKMMN